MRIAVPVTDQGSVSEHFGHCHEFIFFEADPDTKEVREDGRAPSPEHRPGAYPLFLAEQHVDVLLCGGIGFRARRMLEARGIEVVSGVTEARPEQAVRAWVEGTLETNDGSCSGGGGGHGCH